MPNTAIASWREFWQIQDVFPESFWKSNMDIFVREAQAVLNFVPEDTVLDIGCGSGRLAGAIADRVAEVHGVDCAEEVIRHNRERYNHKKNVRFDLLPDSYTDLSQLPDQAYSCIVCLSVIQYYQDKQDVDTLIQQVRRVAKPNARFIIADILPDPSPVRDTLGLLRTAVRERFVCDALRFLWRARRSEYGHLRNTLGLLNFTDNELRQMIERLDLDAQILRLQLTIMPNRRHLLIQF